MPLPREPHPATNTDCERRTASVSPSLPPNPPSVERPQCNRNRRVQCGCFKTLQNDETATMMITITMSTRHPLPQPFWFVHAQHGNILWASARCVSFGNVHVSCKILLRECVCVRILHDLLRQKKGPSVAGSLECAKRSWRAPEPSGDARVGLRCEARPEATTMKGLTSQMQKQLEETIKTLLGGDLDDDQMRMVQPGCFRGLERDGRKGGFNHIGQRGACMRWSSRSWRRSWRPVAEVAREAATGAGQHLCNIERISQVL